MHALLALRGLVLLALLAQQVYMLTVVLPERRKARKEQFEQMREQLRVLDELHRRMKLPVTEKP